MNLSAISSRAWYGKLLRLPFSLIPPDTVVPVLQGRLKGARWVVGSGNHGCWLGSYEYEKRIAFEERVTAGGVVFDVGAHVGFYTLLASRLVGPSGKVVAFEPLPRNLQFLKRHLRLNQVDNVTVIEAAVLDSDGEIAFAEGPNSSMGSVSQQGELKITSVSLDALVSRGEVPAPQYMKIDVEGAELSVLLGARSILSETPPTLFLATHGRDVHQRCCDLLESLGYYLQALTDESLHSTSEVLAIK